MQKISKRSRYKRYRKDKRNYIPRSDIAIKESLPTGIMETRFRADYKKTRHFIPNKKNGAWETTFSYGRFKIRHSKTEGRYYLFYGDQYLDEISKIEQYEFFKRGLQSIGAFEEKINGVHKGKRYVAFQLKAESTWKKENV